LVSEAYNDSKKDDSWEGQKKKLHDTFRHKEERKVSCLTKREENKINIEFASKEGNNKSEFFVNILNLVESHDRGAGRESIFSKAFEQAGQNQIISDAAPAILKIGMFVASTQIFDE
jgi:hypothetical protein